MNKYLKYGLWSFGGLVLLAIGALAYVALTFDPNAYKPQITQAVKDSQERTLKLDGNIKLFFFPSVGANIGQVALSEFRSEQEFASIDNMRVSLALLPLLSGQVVVDEVTLSGARARVVKFKNGKTNLDDLLRKDTAAGHAGNVGKAQTSAPVKFEIASVQIDKTEFSYADEGSGARYSITDLSLKTGRIANGVPSRINSSAHILATRPRLDALLKLQSQFSFDLEQSNFQMKNLQIATAGTKDGDTFDVKLDVAEIGLDKARFSGKGIILNARLNAAAGAVTGSLALPMFEGDAEKFKLNGLALNAEAQRAGQSFKLKLTTPVAGNLKTQQFNLSDIVLDMDASGEKLPGKRISSELKGSMQADITRQSIHAKLSGGLLDSQIKAKLAVNNFAAPAIRYDLEIDRFDADPFIPQAPAETADRKKQATASEQSFDLSFLKPLNLKGSVRIGALKVANVKMNQLRVDMKAKGGVLKVVPFNANLYQGSLASEATLNVNQAVPQFALKAKLNGIEIGPLLNDTLQMDFLSGKGNIGINVTSQGNRVSLLKKGLNGSLSLNLADGAVKGINLAKSMREFGKGGDKTQAATREEKTDFSEMKASFKITNGVAHNEDLSLKSPFIRVGGKGDINLGKDSLEYLAKVTLTGTSEGQGGKDKVGGLTVPVRLSGPFTALNYKLEFGSMVSDALKQKARGIVQKSGGGTKSNVQEQLKQGLKGLFK